jgi:DNA polymerase-3 subunit beta
MVFSVNKKDMSDKLSSLMSIIPSKSNMMVLANFRIEADTTTNTITVVATDLNITTIIKIDANVVEAGSLLISAKHLSDIISSLPDALINFSTNDDQLVIECEKTSFSINYVDSSLYPEIMTLDKETEFLVDAESFKKLIQNSIFCASTDVAHTICNGVYLRMENQLLTLAATDTKRIGEAKCRSDFAIETPFEIVLPTKALQFIEKIINPETENLAIKFDQHRIAFYLGNTTLISNKYDGRYPTYTVAFKNQPNYTLVVDKVTLKDAVRRVSLLSEDDDKLVKISLSNAEVKVESVISERGNAKGLIDKFTYDGPECFFCLNARFLTSFLNVIESDEIVIKFRSPEEPVWLANNVVYDGLEIRFVCMPMRISR